MMLSKVDSRKRVGEGSGDGKLLNDIETISKALYLDKNRPPRSTFSTVSSRSKSVGKAHLPEPKSKIKDDDKDLMDKEKKSIWSWKGLKSLTHVRNRRFNCCFSLQVHSIEGLPPFFDNVSLLVHWKRRDGELITRPVMVFQGVAEFEEQLLHSCSVYGSRSGPHHSAKYEAKHFLVYASVHGTPELDLGKHRVDLTRLLPLTLEELGEEKSSGKWTTSYKLSGKARGAILNVSYGYEIIESNRTGTLSEKDVSLSRNSRQNSESIVKFSRQVDHCNDLSTIRRAGSLPTRSSISQRSSENVKDLHEVLPITKSELSDSINLLYKKFEEEKLHDPIEPIKTKIDIFLEPSEPIKPDTDLPLDSAKENVTAECEIAEFSITDQEAEMPSGKLEKLIEDTEITVHDCAEGSPTRNDTIQMVPEEAIHDPSVSEDPQNEILINDRNFGEDEVYRKESLVKELESALSSVSDKEELKSQVDESEPSNLENDMEVKSDYRTPNKGKSLSLDDETNNVASEFLELLGIEHSPFGLSSESEPESPRELLLRQFEKDALASGSSIFNFVDEDQSDMAYAAPTEPAWGLFSRECNSSSSILTSEELPKIESDVMRHRSKASMLEDLETESLMREWGFNEKAFRSSPPSSSGGFGSPVHIPPEIPDQLPSLGEGLGPFLQTKDGGFLRSMSPTLFRNTKTGGSLIMQVSSPVVMPADMGSGVMDILQHLASVGIEKLSMQANKLMPLEDVTGKTMQQIAWEAAPGGLEGLERQDLLQHESGYGQSISGEHGRVKVKSSRARSNQFESNIHGDKDAEYVSLEDLAPLAMDKMEALAIEGLRIQSGMSDEEAPANISPQSIGEFSALEGKRVGADGSLGLEGAGGLQLLDIKDNGEDVDGLMALSLTLDEWMKLDSGEIYDGDEISERTSKLLAAHHATSLDLIRGKSKGEKRRGKGRNCGLLGNNFTVALMVQLRDPLRNYEPVGTPMLALIQVERVFVPPKPKIYCAVSELRSNNDEDDEPEPTKKDITEQLIEETAPEEEPIAQFKITEVHMAGLKSEPSKKKLWGSTTQQQSGSRWLLANGMGKKNKHPLLKSKNTGKSTLPASTPETTTGQASDTLWSISSRGKGTKGKESAGTRNPNVILPNEKMRLLAQCGFS